jgi:UDP:flavonoid glycosyltransferase YjiC (YdhE family)
VTRIAVAHYPEGAGHATRMAAVANELRDRGASVEFAGGGPGTDFARMHGYDPCQPTVVDYIGDYQDGGSLLDVLRNSVPDTVRRIRDFVGWIRRVDPDAVVTDDMFAGIAAGVTGTPLFVTTHNAAALYEGSVERFFTRLWTRYQCAASRVFLLPAVWPPLADGPGCVVRIPPIALEAGDETAREESGPADPGVVVVPSHYSGGDADLADRIAEDHDVTRVGGDDWEPVPAMVPVLRRAEAVVCAGYSTIMEAAVAGTPCVVYPHTDEQRGVGRVLSRNAVEGFHVVDSPDSVVSILDDPAPPEPRDNGAPVAARAILERL